MWTRPNWQKGNHVPLIKLDQNNLIRIKWGTSPHSKSTTMSTSASNCSRSQQKFESWFIIILQHLTLLSYVITNLFKIVRLLKIWEKDVFIFVDHFINNCISRMEVFVTWDYFIKYSYFGTITYTCFRKAWYWRTEIFDWAAYMYAYNINPYKYQ